MSRIQGASIAALLVLASAATHADTLLVNTLEDESNVVGKSCSLREAVSYIHNKNRIRKDLPAIETSLSGKTSQISSREADKKIRETQLEGATGSEKATLEAEIAQLNHEIATLKSEVVVLQQAKATIETQTVGLQVYGCIPSTAPGTDGDIINLDSATYIPDSATKVTLPFKLTRGAIHIQDILTIKGPDDSDNQDTTQQSPLPSIRVDGAFQAFIIDDGNADQKVRIQITFTNLNLVGCNQPGHPNVCAVNGGLISNREVLEIQNVSFKYGNASGLGGGLYVSDYGLARLTNATFEENTAADGAAIYSFQPGLQIQQSVFVKNSSPAAGSAVLKMVNPTFPDSYGPTTGASVSASTFSGNSDSTAIRIPDTVKLVNLTIVLNKVGVDFNSLNLDITNSIIAGNTAGDCLSVNAAILTKFKYNLFSTACPILTVADNNRQLDPTKPEETLIAATTPAGTCALPPANGLLCPLGSYGGKTRSHRPRLLAIYTSLDQSPIVNKGGPRIVDSPASCSGTDQRATDIILCDIGAIELVTLNTDTDGKDVISGETVTLNMLDKTGDGELLPAAQCPPNIPVNVDYHPDIDGCPTLSIKPQKGTISFNPVTHDIVYTPNYAYHGRDNFSYTMITTLSRFSNAANNQAVTIRNTLVSEPTNTFKSKTFAGGGFQFPVLAGLAGLLFLRRRMKRG